MLLRWPTSALLVAALALSGGGSSDSPGSTASGTGGSGSAPAGPAAQAPSEQQAAATGDIPDNQVFLTFRDRALRISLRYPEGWTESRLATGVSFTDKANRVS